jgi:broad specificity phosphatase PhoE
VLEGAASGGKRNVAAIYFIRHGRTDYNEAKRLQGITDVPINALGCEQAKRNGAVLNELIGDKSRFDFVASPLMRARRTMEIIREAMGLDPAAYRTDDRLREVHFGGWAGLTMAQVKERDAEHYARRQADLWNIAPPGGECVRDLSARAVSWFESVDRDTVCVSHGGIYRCLYAHFLKLTPDKLVSLDVPQDKMLLIEQESLPSDGGAINPRSSSLEGGSAINPRSSSGSAINPRSSSPEGGSALRMTWL